MSCSIELSSTTIAVPVTKRRVADTYECNHLRENEQKYKPCLPVFVFICVAAAERLVLEVKGVLSVEEARKES